MRSTVLSVLLSPGLAVAAAFGQKRSLKVRLRHLVVHLSLSLLDRAYFGPYR
jgi:hypothetical protein